tara:strand:- start:1199 stop:1378 length:180 start_codon:yes stop_codon:yes gene_type:complete
MNTLYKIEYFTPKSNDTIVVFASSPSKEEALQVAWPFDFDVDVINIQEICEFKDILIKK